MPLGHANYKNHYIKLFGLVFTGFILHYVGYGTPRAKEIFRLLGSGYLSVPRVYATGHYAGR